MLALNLWKLKACREKRNKNSQELDLPSNPFNIQYNLTWKELLHYLLM